jgi:hypothetical protein
MMLVQADGVARGAFALKTQDGTILLSDIDEDAAYVHRLSYGYSVSHPEYGECTVIPVTVTVNACAPDRPQTSPSEAVE